MTAASTKLSDLVDDLVARTDGDKVTLGELLEAVHTRSFGPMLLVPALVAASPLGAVPGMSVVTGSVIVLVASQLLLGWNRPWLPQRLLDLEFDRSRLTSARKTMRPWLRWAERPVRARLTRLTEFPFSRAVAACCILLAMSFYPLAVVPFAVFMPATAVCFYALGLTARDGLLVLFALVLTVAVIVTAVVFWPF